MNTALTKLDFAFSNTSLPGATDKIVFLPDISGSTGNDRFYHRLSREISEQVKPDFIIGWDWAPRNLSDLEYQRIVTQQEGFGGTCTSAIAKGLLTLVPAGSPIHIIILTDGDVQLSDISLCDKLMEEVTSRHKILSVTAYISSSATVNCSVLAPFLRGEWSSLVFHDSHNNTVLTPVHSINTVERSELLELVKTATTEEEINAIYDRFVTLLTAMTMGKSSGDPQMRALILEMFARIKANIKKKLSQETILVDLQTEFRDTKDISVKSACDLHTWYTSTFNGGEFQAKIDFLLNICDGKLSHLFDPQQVRAASLQRATVNTTPQSDQQLAQIVPSDKVTPIQCPIMLDECANWCIMITGSPLFPKIEPSQQDAIRSNTFYATSLNDLLKTRLDHGISLEAYLSMPDQTISPMTRAEISGCIVLGADPISVKAANHAIGLMVLGKSGVIGNPDIWFYVIYNCIKGGNTPWLEHLLPMFENQLRYRMEHSGCTIAMSGLATHIQLKSTFGVALRFVLSQVELGMKKECSSFPIFSGSIQHIITLLKMFGCEIPDKLQKYCTIVHRLGQLVAEVKELHLGPFGIKYRALVGNFHQITPEDLSPSILENSQRNGWFHEYVPVDGPHTDTPAYAVDMTVDECNLTYNLSKLIIAGGTESTTTFTIMDSQIPYHSIEKLFDEPIPIENDWKLYVHPLRDSRLVIIHPATMRPPTYTDAIHWKHGFETYYNRDKHFIGPVFDDTAEKRPSGDVFNGCKMYCTFVSTYNIHPTLADFVLYCYMICNNSQYRHSTIPFVEFCEQVINGYKFSRDISIVEFIHKYDASMNRDERLEIERSHPI